MKILKKLLKKFAHLFPFLEPYLFKYFRSNKRSKGEILVASILDNNNIKYKQEYLIKFPFKVKNKNYVFIDFYIPSKKTFIEYNGKQHYEYVPYFHKSEKDFEAQVRRDNIVREYCKDNGIKLIEIPYTLNENSVKMLLLHSL